LKQETRIRKETLNPRQDKNYLLIADQIRVVDRMNAQIDPELTAQAALQCKAFARSLRSFEQRMSELRNTQGRKDADLQAYYEHLHRIYADLDEPDGMEGVTSKVLEPSLEHQIREHESVGRWTSAQSCWEVRLQQSPDDVQLHIGLLRCLRSLGHYGELQVQIL
jgi:serine/threonine-protein kinase ATR